jgi:hypothetical protein
MNTMAIYTVKLKSRQEIAFETMAFHFEKPEGFTYNPLSAVLRFDFFEFPSGHAAD